MPVTHPFVNPVADDLGFPGTKPSDWNAPHVINIVNADVDPAAAIDESKLNLNFPTHAAVTLGAPANGLSLVGQQISIGLASGAATGALSSVDWTTFNNKQSALTFPLAPDLGGTGIANAVGSTLTLGGATTISTGGTIALGGFTLTVPATGTVALLAVANVFTATQAIQGEIPALQFLDTTGGATSSGFFVNGNSLFITSGVLTSGVGVVMEMQLGVSPFNINFYGSFTCIPVAGLQRIRFIPADPAIEIKDTSDTRVIYITSDFGAASYINPAGAGAFGIGTSTPAAKFHVVDKTNTITNAVKEVMRIEAIISTAATGGAAGFGPGLSLRAETATDGTNQQQGLISTYWVDSTNATRKATLALSAYDTAERKGIEIRANGSTPDIVLLGDTWWEGEGFGLPYGSIWGNEIGWTQAAAVQDTWYEISDADISDGQLNLVTHDGSGLLTVTKAGRYKIDYSLSAECSLTNKHVQSGISVSGTEQNDGIDHAIPSTANEQFHLSSTAILDLAANATIQISVRTTDAGTPDISVDHINVSIFMVGGT